MKQLIRKILKEEYVKPNIRVITEESNEFKTNFIINGDEYWFQARDEEKMYPEHIRYGWHLGFGRGQGEDKYLPTGEGKQFEVFSALKESLDIFVHTYNPPKMSFIAEGETKANIYLKLLTKYGYKVTKEDAKLDTLTGKVPILFKLTK